MSAKDTTDPELIVSKPPRIGIIGGGQLGKMLASVAKRLSIKVVVLDPSPDCPASSLADEQIIADFKDDAAISKLAAKCDVITFEIELANSRALKELEAKGFPVRPAPATLSIIQNKFRQKTFLRENGLPVPDFALAESQDQVRSAIARFGFPVMLKACEDSYDGRGNFVIRSESDISSGLKYFAGRQCMLEEYIHFKKEISVMVARNPRGQIELFPLVENIHKNNILDTTLVPARVSQSVAKRASQIAKNVMSALGGSGIFGIEMFVDKGGQVFVNEIAPRPHNSGHYSNEACSVSQFELHLRCVLDLPLVKPELIAPAAMINILGPPHVDGQYGIEGLSDALSVQGVVLYIYGKSTSRPSRKIGHLTATGKTLRQSLYRARLARRMIKIVGTNIANLE